MIIESEVLIPIDSSIVLSGQVIRPQHLKGWVIFVHGSGSSQFSPRNREVAKKLNREGFGTLLFDLLTLEEDLVYQNRFDIGLLAWRTQKVTDWFVKSDFYHHAPIAYFGASTGAAAALVAASMDNHPSPVYTVISRGGRPDMAGVDRLRHVHVPVLLIVGSLDRDVLKLNNYANKELPHSQVILIEGASHLFEESGALDEVIRTTLRWLNLHLPLSKSQNGSAPTIEHRS